MGLAAIRPLKRLDSNTKPVLVFVAVGLAAIRPLKHYCAQNYGAQLNVAVGLAAIRPLKPLISLFFLLTLFRVAVGLAAIRPLKLSSLWFSTTISSGCSGFGRYQAVETVYLDAVTASNAALQWVWPLSGR